MDFIEPPEPGIYQVSSDIADIKADLSKDSNEFGRIFDTKKFQKGNSNHSISAEVGDDQVIISSCHYIQLYFSILRRILHVKISMKDTSIHPNVGTYSESIIVKPLSVFGTWYHSRKKDDFVPFQWIDFPKLRSLIPVGSTRENFGSTLEGKVQVVRNGIYQTKNPRFAHLSTLAFLFQASSFGWNGDRPLFVPTQLGGLGMRLRGQNRLPLLIDYLDRYKRGQYRNHYLGCLVDLYEYDAKSFAEKLKEEPPASIIDMSMSTRHFRDWEKYKEKFLRTPQLALPKRIRDTCLGGFREFPIDYRPVLTRLISDGYLITDENIQVHYEHVLYGVVMLRAALSDKVSFDTKSFKEVRQIANRISGSWGNRFFQGRKRRFLTQKDVHEVANILPSIEEGWRFRCELHNSLIFPPDALSEVYKTSVLLISEDGGLKSSIPWSLIGKDQIKEVDLNDPVDVYDHNKSFSLIIHLCGERNLPKLHTEMTSRFSQGKLDLKDILPSLPVNTDHAIRLAIVANLASHYGSVQNIIVVTDDIKLLLDLSSEHSDIEFIRYPISRYIVSLYYHHDIMGAYYKVQRLLIGRGAKEREPVRRLNRKCEEILTDRFFTFKQLTDRCRNLRSFEQDVESVIGKDLFTYAQENYVYIDVGSFCAHEEKHFRDGNYYLGESAERYLSWTGLSDPIPSVGPASLSEMLFTALSLQWPKDEHMFVQGRSKGQPRGKRYRRSSDRSTSSSRNQRLQPLDFTQ